MTREKLLEAWYEAKESESGIGDTEDYLILYRHDGKIYPTDSSLDLGCEPIEDVEQLMRFAEYNELLDKE